MFILFSIFTYLFIEHFSALPFWFSYFCYHYIQNYFKKRNLHFDSFWIFSKVLKFRVAKLRNLWVLNSKSLRWVYIAISSYLDSAFKGVFSNALLIKEYFIDSTLILAVNTTHLNLAFIVVECIQIKVCIVTPLPPPGCWDQIAFVVFFVVYEKTLVCFHLWVKWRLFVFTFLVYYWLFNGLEIFVSLLLLYLNAFP